MVDSILPADFDDELEAVRRQLAAIQHEKTELSASLRQHDTCNRAWKLITRNQVATWPLAVPVAQVLQQELTSARNDTVLDKFSATVYSRQDQRLAVRSLVTLSTHRVTRELGTDSSTFRVVVEALETSTQRATDSEVVENGFKALGQFGMEAPQAVVDIIDSAALIERSIEFLTERDRLNQTGALGAVRVIALVAVHDPLPVKSKRTLGQVATRAVRSKWRERESLGHIIIESNIGEQEWRKRPTPTGRTEYGSFEHARPIGEQLVEQSLAGDRSAAKTLRQLYRAELVDVDTASLPTTPSFELVTEEHISSGDNREEKLAVIGELVAAGLLDPGPRPCDWDTALWRLAGVALNDGIGTPFRDLAIFTVNDLHSRRDEVDVFDELFDILSVNSLIYPATKSAVIGGLALAPDTPTVTSSDDLIEKLPETSPEVCTQMLQGLGMLLSTNWGPLDHRQYITGVVSQLANGVPNYVLEQAIEYPASVGALDGHGEVAARAFLEHIRNHLPDSDIHYNHPVVAAVKALGQLAETDGIDRQLEPTIQTLSTLIQSSLSTTLRSEAALSLGAFAEGGQLTATDPNHIPVDALIRLYEDGFDHEALLVLEQLLDAGIVRTLPEAFVTELIAYIQDSENLLDDLIFEVLAHLAQAGQVTPSTLQPILEDVSPQYAISGEEIDGELADPPFDDAHAEKFFKTLKTAYEHADTEVLRDPLVQYLTLYDPDPRAKVHIVEILLDDQHTSNRSTRAD